MIDISTPGPHAIAIMIVAMAAFYLYTRPWIRMELVSLLLLAALLCVFYLFPYAGVDAPLTETEILESFGHPALIAICCLMVLGRGLSMTGALDPAVRVLSRIWAWNRALGLLVTLIGAGLASAVVNDTPVLVLMLPLLLRLADRTGYSAAKTLLPVNYAILVGGTLTSIGTSTNLLVLKTAEDLGVRSIGIFDFTPLALVAFAVALPYLWLILPRLLPDGTGPNSHDAVRKFEARLQVAADNERLMGKGMRDLKRALGRDIAATGVLRNGTALAADDTLRLEAGDVLMLSDTPTGLRDIASALRTDLFDREGAGLFVTPSESKEDIHLAELVIGAHSALSGRSLRDARFADGHAVIVVGLYRGAAGLLRYAQDFTREPLMAGDVLLVQGTSDNIAALRALPDLMLVDQGMPMPRSPLAPLALCIMGMVVLLAATKVMPIHVSAALGMVAMLATGCVRLDGIGRALSLEVVLLVASSVALGRGLVGTGGAQWLGEIAAFATGNVAPALQLALLMTFAALLTNFVSNAAAAAVGTPIAVATATALGVDAEPYVLAILFGANLSFATPTAYQTNVLVMNAAGYRFRDFVRGGLPLVLLLLITFSLLLAHRYSM
ncbi:MAG: SLC13 family permease [Pseudomonadota bacterium]